MRTPIRMVAAAVVLLCLALPAALAQDDGSAFDKLDASDLANVLAQLKMNEMLEAFQSGLGASGGGLEPKLIIIQARKALLDDPQLTLEDRAKLIDEITGLYRNIVQLAAAEVASKKDMDKDRALIKSYELRFEFAEFLGSKVVDNNVLNLLLLRAGPGDAAFVIQKTGEAVSGLDKLNRDIQQTLQAWRGDSKRTVIVIPLMDELNKKVAYYSGWIYFNRGLALRGVAGKEKERDGLLPDAIVQANPFADGDADTGVKFWALLLRGMALRERGEYAPAATSVKAAAASDDRDIRWRSQFELARIAIESGDKQAKAACDAFTKAATEIFGADRQIAVDILDALLLNYLYETQAAATRNPKLVMEGHKALLDFANKYNEPGELRDWAGVVANKYGLKPDPARSDAMVLLAAGMMAMLREPKDIETGSQMLTRILSGTDELSLSARPLALWHMGLLDAEQRETLKAASKFKDLAEKYDKHRLAPIAAKNAVIAFRDVIHQRRTATPPQPVGTLLQKQYIGSLEHLLKNYLDKDKDNPKWYVELGLEYQAQAREAGVGPLRKESRQKAVAAYEKVPKDEQEPRPFLSARATALELRVRMWEEDLTQAEAASAGPGLVKDLLDFAKDAQERAAGPNNELKDSLKEWGARAEFGAGKVQFTTERTETKAINTLEAIPQRWPGTTAEGEAIEYLISKLIAEGKTDKAVTKLEDFRKNHPERAGHLIQQVVQQIQVRIETLRGKRESLSDLNRYRGTYYNFTKDLYDRVKDQPIADRYRWAQLYGSGLVEKGYAVRDGDRKPEEAKKFFQEALAVYEECEKFDSSKRDVEAKKITDAFDAYEKNILPLIVDAAGAQNAHDAYVKAIKESGLVVEGVDPDGKKRDVISGPGEIRGGILLLQAAKTETEKTARLERIRSKVKEQLMIAREALLRNLPWDAENLPGLARCHRALGAFDKAADYYKKVVDGLEYFRTLQEGPEKERLATMYWRLFLEQCENALEGSKSNPDRMKALVRSIRLARSIDENMGGYAPQFMAIETEAEEASKASPPAKR